MNPLSGLFVCLFFLGPLIVPAQENSNPVSPHNKWISLNTGIVYPIIAPAFYADASFEYSTRHSIYTVQYFGLNSIGNSAPESDSHKWRNFEGFNIQYGLIHRLSLFKLSCLAGLSLMFVKEMYNAEKVDLYLGVPLSVQMVFTPIPLIGIGLRTNLNLNSHRTFLSTLIGLYFGKTR